MNEPRDPSDYRPTSGEWADLVGSQREDQYTPMGEVFMFGDFASGVNRARGWKRWLSLSVVLIILVPMLVGIAWTIARALLAWT